MVIRLPEERTAQGGYAVLDDRVLVLDFQAGNPQAFVEIHSRYAGLARQVCRRFLPNAQDADEAFQETMIRAFQGLYRFNGRYALGPWIARIAKNVSLDILRGRARRPQESGSPASEELPKPGDEADEIVERLVQRDLVLSTLADLPESHRQALMLRELEGRSHREVAQALEISPGQAKALIHRAKGSFRRRWLEKLAERGGLMGVALLPLIWLARAAYGARRVIDRLGSAAQVAQSAVPEAVTQTAAVSATPAAAGVGERLVAAGMTILVAGGVTFGAAKIADRGYETRPVRVAAQGSAAAPTAPPVPSQHVDPPTQKDVRLGGSIDEEIRAEPPAIDPTPSPAVEPTPSPVIEPVIQPSPTPAPTPEPSPAPETPPAPAWGVTFVTNISTEATCLCEEPRLVRSRLVGTPGGKLSFSQLIWAPVLDAERDRAWSVAVDYKAAVEGDVGRMTLRVTVLTDSGPVRLDGAAVLTERVATEEGDAFYRFNGSYAATTEVGGDAIVPRSGQLIVGIGFWRDGTPYLASFALLEG